PPCPSTESHMDVQGYRRVQWRVLLCHLGAVLSAGLLLLLFHWRPRLGVWARCQPCPLSQAQLLLIRDSHGQRSLVDVISEEVEEGSLEQPGAEPEEPDWRDTVQLHKEETPVLRYYIFEGLRYVWLARKGAFCRVRWVCASVFDPEYHFTPQNRDQQYAVSYSTAPCPTAQHSVSGCICAQCLSDQCVDVAVCPQQSVTLRRMAQLVVSVLVRRASGEEESVNSLDLVPGDCLLVPPEGLLLPCDAALLEGECMVNESLLTGESVPVMKTPLLKGTALYSPDAHQRHTLFCGTQVIQAKGASQVNAIAVVTRTGFFTAKGDLVSSIMYPQPINFRFYSDSMKFLLFLGLLAAVGTVYSLVILGRSGLASLGRKCVQGLSGSVCGARCVQALCVEPGVFRLCVWSAVCSGPVRLGVWSPVCSGSHSCTPQLTPAHSSTLQLTPAHPSHTPAHPSSPQPHSALCCCFTALLQSELLFQEEPQLYSLATGVSELQEPEEEASKLFGGVRVLAVMKPPAPEQQPQGITPSRPLAILRRFPFSSALQRMGVVVRAAGETAALAFLKGAPEMVASLCRRDSVPASFSMTLHQFASDGFRVLGLAYKSLTQRSQEELEDMTREAVESGMQFLGFLVMRNLVKPETAPVISTLRQASIRTIMATGDNILTAVNVARGCGMVAPGERVIFVHGTPPLGCSPPTLRFLLAESGGATQDGVDFPAQGLYQQAPGPYHLALNGKSFSVLCEHFPEYLPKVLLRGTIYARMAPEQKTQLVKELQKINYCVAMCGDGANDCGALRAADVGVSLSEAEASVASPFTSHTDDITCIPLLIREGRCSLVTSFGLFRYMALYSLIQFSSVLILYTVKTNLGDLQFLFFDLVLVTSLAIVMGRSGPADQLCARRPPASLLAAPVLTSLLLHTLLLVLTQISTLFITKAQDWFVPLNDTVVGAGNLPNFENTGLFGVTGYQYLIMAIVLSKGHPFRKPLYTNVLFMLVLAVLCAFMSWLVLYPLHGLRQLLSLQQVDDMKYKLLLVALSALNFFCALMLEVLVEQALPCCLQRLRGPRPSKKLYKRLDSVLRLEGHWPPLDQPLPSPGSTAIDVR
uniref:ATPase cation transporting 13A2 n=1 Tax=Lepisosteus oculatus TaxID=7918 RepID=W5MM41_LEPOC